MGGKLSGKVKVKLRKFDVWLRLAVYDGKEDVIEQEEDPGPGPAQYVGPCHYICLSRDFRLPFAPFFGLILYDGLFEVTIGPDAEISWCIDASKKGLFVVDMKRLVPEGKVEEEVAALVARGWKDEN